jgi:hypothetical protein
MISTSRFRRIAIFLCVAALLLAAFTPAAHGLPFAILVTLWFWVAITLSFRLRYIDKQSHPQPALALPAFSPRPPPAL